MQPVAPVIASIDPDPFYDFTQERPEVYLDDDDERHVRWPSNEFRLMRNPGRAHDLVVLSGVEPHLRFATFADSIITVARRLGCSVVVTPVATVPLPNRKLTAEDVLSKTSVAPFWKL